MKKKFFLVVFFAICLFGFLELLLKLKGHELGRFQVESIKHGVMLDTVSSIFTTDSFGIYMLDHGKLEEVLEAYDLCNRSVGFDFDIDNIESIIHASRCLQLEINELQDTCNVCDRVDQNYPFRDYLLSKSNSIQDSYLFDYLEHPINEDGFRSIPFATYDSTDKIKVLLIGDSYVWGLSAEPIYNSYADLLLSKDYIVFNTGIPGSDPAQYAAIAKKYIPILKPDVIIVNYYVANDFMFFKREPKINEPLEYATKDGFVASAPAGVFLELDELVQYYESLLLIPNQDKNIVHAFCAKTRVGSSIIWPLLLLLKWSDHEVLNLYKEYLNTPLMERAKISKLYMDEIEALAQLHGIPSLYVVIPEVPFIWNKDQIIKNEGENKQALDFVFSETGYYFPEIFSKNDNAESGHLNNQGADKFATYLDELIKDKLGQ